MRDKQCIEGMWCIKRYSVLAIIIDSFTVILNLLQKKDRFEIFSGLRCCKKNC
jgi:hypothetical protein